MTNRKNAVLCPKCRKLISRDEPVCPYCGTKHPGAFWKNNAGAKVFYNPDTFIRIVIYINIGLFLLSFVLSRRIPQLTFNPLQAFSPDNESLILLGASGTLPINHFHRWWSLVSASYLHGSLLHIIFNMIVFRQITPLMIREYGLYRFITIYTLGGIAGFFVSYLAGIQLTIGASAAIFSVVGALFFYGYSRGGIYGQVLYKQIGGWIIFLFLFGLIVPGINNWGHGGGIITGFLLALVLGYNEKVAENAFHRWLGMACIIITILVLLWAVGSGVFIRFML